MDILSTASLIFDIGWIADDLFGSSAQNAKNAAQLARASRASRVGTRAGRIIRFIFIDKLNTLTIYINKQLKIFILDNIG